VETQLVQTQLVPTQPVQAHMVKTGLRLLSASRAPLLQSDSGRHGRIS